MIGAEISTDGDVSRWRATLTGENCDVLEAGQRANRELDEDVDVLTADSASGRERMVVREVAGE